MKRLLLVCASLLIGLTTASATELNNPKPQIKLEKKKNYRFAQPIMFEERGVEFFIFPDGSFDFNTKTNNGFYDDDYYRNNSRRSSINVNHRGPNSNTQYTSNRYPNKGVSISRDRDGTVRRIGNVYLNYDRNGNITRVGSVFINYSRGRNATVNQVGGLRVTYNRWGEIINTRGSVNRFNRNNNYQIRTDNDRDNNHYDDDDNYYYYKQNGKVKKQKKNKR
ncbi:hypothetical protein [Algibacter sp.]|uniref:hypothetical protein n=1 Tax=Algibacter sp. TaxID=1872428 RepID=UPI003C7327E2